MADIGCDHGKLTAVLAASGKYPKVIGADLRPGPLAKAEQTLEHAGCKDRAELRLGDGLSVLSYGERSRQHRAGGRFRPDHMGDPGEGTVGVHCGGPRIIMIPATRHECAAPLVVGARLPLCSRPPGAGGGPLVRRHGSRVHRRDARTYIRRVPVWRHRPLAGGEKATPTGRKQSCPASASACRTAVRLPPRSMQF